MSSSTRHDRMERVRARMEAMGVDVVLLSLGADLPWLTGYRAMALERLTLLVVTRQDDAVLLVPELEAPRVPDPAGAFTVRSWSEAEDPFDLAAALVAAGGGAWPGATLAVSDRAWAGALLALQQRLPRSRWVASSAVVSPLRAVKDLAEIAVLRAAA